MAVKAMAGATRRRGRTWLGVTTAAVVVAAMLVAAAPATAKPEWHEVLSADANCPGPPPPAPGTLGGIVGFHYDAQDPPRVNEVVPVRLALVNLAGGQPCPLLAQFEAVVAGSLAIFPEAPVLCSLGTIPFDTDEEAEWSPPAPCGARVGDRAFSKDIFSGGTSELHIAPRDEDSWRLSEESGWDLRFGAVFHEPRSSTEDGAIGAAWLVEGAATNLLTRTHGLPIRPGKPLQINWAEVTGRKVARSGFPIFPAASSKGRVKAKLVVDRKGARGLGLAKRVKGRTLTVASKNLRIDADSTKRRVMRIRKKRDRSKLKRASGKKLRRAKFTVKAKLVKPNGKRSRASTSGCESRASRTGVWRARGP